MDFLGTFQFLHPVFDHFRIHCIDISTKRCLQQIRTRKECLSGAGPTASHWTRIELPTKCLRRILCTARSINGERQSSPKEARLKRTYHVLQRKRSAHIPSLLWVFPKVRLQHTSACTRLFRQLLDIIRNGIKFFLGATYKIHGWFSLAEVINSVGEALKHIIYRSSQSFSTNIQESLLRSWQITFWVTSDPPVKHNDPQGPHNSKWLARQITHLGILRYEIHVCQKERLCWVLPPVHPP